jgi:hypothetical protein
MAEPFDPTQSLPANAAGYDTITAQAATPSLTESTVGLSGIAPYTNLAPYAT